MLLKLIACEIFTREICYCVARSPHRVDLEFTDIGAHENSDTLRTILQERIDRASKSKKNYDAVLLCYGLCGNATVNLTARKTRLVIPRAHDCCTLFLGSKKKFQKYFGNNPSRPFYATGCCEREYDNFSRRVNIPGAPVENFESYVKRYGQENAEYLWDILHQKEKEPGDMIFIQIQETARLGYAEKCRVAAAADGKKYIELPGDIRLIKNLVFGNWKNEDFLVVQPFHRTTGVYDWDEIIRAKKLSSHEHMVTDPHSNP